MGLIYQKKKCVNYTQMSHRHIHVDNGETNRILNSIIEILDKNGKHDLAEQFGQNFKKKESEYIVKNIYQAPEHTEGVTYCILIKCCNEMLTNLDTQIMDQIGSIIQSVQYI